MAAWSRLRPTLSRASLRPLSSESVAYKRSMLRPPVAVPSRGLPANSCSFIGSVARPVRRYAGSSPGSAVYTFLDVKPSSFRPSELSPFTVLLKFEDKLAEISLEHLKQNDLIYVRGCLGSYEKVNANGNRKTFYKVAVKELNYVKEKSQSQSEKADNCRKEDLATVHGSGLFIDESTLSAGSPDDERKLRDCHHLWQVFFANPYEWWDNRQKKLQPWSPDFRHKDTHECLWLHPNDPPWVRRQLELYDSNMVTGWQRNSRSQQGSQGWKLKDFE